MLLKSKRTFKPNKRSFYVLTIALMIIYTFSFCQTGYKIVLTLDSSEIYRQEQWFKNHEEKYIYANVDSLPTKVYIFFYALPLSGKGTVPIGEEFILLPTGRKIPILKGENSIINHRDAFEDYQYCNTIELIRKPNGEK